MEQASRHAQPKNHGSSILFTTKHQKKNYIRAYTTNRISAVVYSDVQHISRIMRKVFLITCCLILYLELS